jgi:CubicO group peptidase (beta-lactamase class C family)
VNAKLTFALLLWPIVLIDPARAQIDAELQPFLQQTLQQTLAEKHLPAVAALIQIDGKVAAEAAVGVRAMGRSEAVTLRDRWHIGSDSKAFTSTLIARLVEQHLMSFEDTLAKSFPTFAKKMHPKYRNVTVMQLLSHTGGLPQLTDDKELPAFMAVIGPIQDVREQRAAIARKYLTMPPPGKAGEFSYSNLGFIIAGAIAEARTGKSWEMLVREQVFEPLDIENAGFGAPGLSSKIDQPRGHSEIKGTLVPLDPGSVDADNPAALGPAGTINISLRDWALFAQDQLDGELGHGKLLEAASYKRLHTVVSHDYALGWGVVRDAAGELQLLTHTGSNGYWLADIRIMPPHDMIFLIATNAGNEAANQALKDIRKSLKDRLNL